MRDHVQINGNREDGDENRPRGDGRFATVYFRQHEGAGSRRQRREQQRRACRCSGEVQSEGEKQSQCDQCTR